MNENYRWLGKKRPNSLESLVNKNQRICTNGSSKETEKKKKSLGN